MQVWISGTSNKLRKLDVDAEPHPLSYLSGVVLGYTLGGFATAALWAALFTHQAAAPPALGACAVLASSGASAPWMMPLPSGSGSGNRSVAVVSMACPPACHANLSAADRLLLSETAAAASRACCYVELSAYVSAATAFKQPYNGTNTSIGYDSSHNASGSGSKSNSSFQWSGNCSEPALVAALTKPAPPTDCVQAACQLQLEQHAKGVQELWGSWSWHCTSAAAGRCNATTPHNGSDSHSAARRSEREREAAAAEVQRKAELEERVQCRSASHCIYLAVCGTENVREQLAAEPDTHRCPNAWNVLLWALVHTDPCCELLK